MNVVCEADAVKLVQGIGVTLSIPLVINSYHCRRS